jgi:hypothetical protein
LNEDVGGKVVGPGSLLGSPPSDLREYAVSREAVAWSSFAPGRQDIMVGRRTEGQGVGYWMSFSNMRPECVVLDKASKLLRRVSKYCTTHLTPRGPYVYRQIVSRLHE